MRSLLVRSSVVIAPFIALACSDAASFEQVDESNGAGNQGSSLSTPLSMTVLYGRISTVRAVPQARQTAAPASFVLHATDKKAYRLSVPPALVANLGGPDGLARLTVRVTGAAAPNGLFAVSTVEKAPLPGASLAAPSALSPVRGTLRVATIPCRFPASESAAAETPGALGAILDGRPGHLGRYFSVSSYGRFSLDASNVFQSNEEGSNGWVFMPSPLTEYGNTGYDIDTIVNDCVQNAFFDGMSFNDVDAINVALSHNLPQRRAYTTQRNLGDWGTDRTVPVAVTSPIIFRDHASLARSIGYMLGMRHSTSEVIDIASSIALADSQWDAMSEGGRCSALHPAFGCSIRARNGR